MVPQSVAFIPAFVQTLDDRWISASHIVLLVKIPDMEAYVATTVTMQTFRVSSYIAEQLLRGAARDPKIAQERAA